MAIFTTETFKNPYIAVIPQENIISRDTATAGVKAGLAAKAINDKEVININSILSTILAPELDHVTPKAAASVSESSPRAFCVGDVAFAC